MSGAAASGTEVTKRAGAWFDTDRTSGVPRLHPRRLPTPRRAELVRRGATIAGVAAHHLLPLALRQARQLRHGVLPPAVIAPPLRRTCEQLGGTFVKFAQMIASSPGLFGEEVADEFRSALDTGPAVPFAEVCQRIEDDLGMSIGEAFSELEPEAIGCASIAVVYRARLHDGRQIAVKVLRPGIEALVAADLDLMQPLVEIVARETGDQMAGALLQLVDGLRQQLAEELDLRNEARALWQFRRLAAEVGLSRAVVPEPYPELSGPNVLTMQYLDGIPIDDMAKIAELGYDPAPLVSELLHGLLATTVRWGVFHGDLHAGNMLLLRDGRIGIIDWGIVGRLDEDTHRFFIRVLQAALGDESAWPDVTAHLTKVYGRAIQEGLGMSDEQLTAFLRSLIEPTLTRPFGEVSLAALFAAPQIQAAKAQGVKAHELSVRAVVARLRAGRRMRRLADEAGGIMSDFDRASFLLGKQLMYFERYGRLFLADVPILADREFFAQVLAGVGEPAAERGSDVSSPGGGA